MILNESINNNNYYDSLNSDYNRLLNEQYYGSNKYTYQIDSIMEQAIILSKNKNTVENNEKLQELAFKLENILVKMFNFKYVDVTFKEIFGVINAYTMENLDHEDIKNGNKYNKEKTSTGIRYIKPIKSMNVTIGLGLLRQKEMTPRMASAVLFHEIGHNFFFEDSSVYLVNKYTLVFVLICQALSKLNPIDLLRFVSQSINGYFTNKKNMDQNSKGNIIFTKIGNSIVNLINIENTILTLTIGGLFTPLSKCIGNLANFLNKGMKTDDPGYRNEQFADNFATSYGYGKETVQVEKMFLTSNGNKFDDMIQRNKFFGRYRDWILSSLKDCDVLADVHPDNVARCIDQMKYLEDNLKYIKDPKEKKKIKKDLEDVKKALNDVKKLADKGGELEKQNKTTLRDKLKYAIEHDGGEAYKNNKVYGKKNGQWDVLV